MNNYKDAIIGKRIRLLSTMKNESYSTIPEEDIPVGTEGTIVHVSIHGSKHYDQIGVNWDNGRSLNVFPYSDHYEIFDGERVSSTIN
jgi:hypothetical protein